MHTRPAIRWGKGAAERDRQAKAQRQSAPKKEDLVTGTMWRLKQPMLPWSRQSGSLLRLGRLGSPGVIKDGTLVTYLGTKRVILETNVRPSTDLLAKSKADHLVQYTFEHYFLEGGNVWKVTPDLLKYLELVPQDD